MCVHREGGEERWWEGRGRDKQKHVETEGVIR